MRTTPLIAAVALLACAAGCRPALPRRPPSTQRESPRPVNVQAAHPTFHVQDEQGQPVMDATAESSAGTIAPGSGKGTQAVGNGPVEMTAPVCLMYKKGKPDLHIRAKTAVWKDGQLVASGGVHVETADGSVKADADHSTWKDEVLTMFQVKALLSQKGQPKMRLTAPHAISKGDDLIADQTAHAETPDGQTKLDAKRAVWNRSTGHLVLSSATGAQFEGGKQTLAAAGPRAEYQNDWLTLPASGSAHRLDSNTTMRADRIRWNRVTAQAMADGNVQLRSPDMWIEGQHFVGNTSLKKGKLTGGRPRMHLLKKKA